MRNASLKIVNQRGLHARAASKLVDLTKAYASQITLVYQGKAVDAKSIMSVLMLGAPMGSELEVQTSGEDEEAAAAAVAELFAAGFYETDDL